jgi:hypothetical protein
MEDYPRTTGEFEARFSSEKTCREYLFQAALAERFSMSTVWPRHGVGGECHTLAVLPLRSPNFGHGGDGVSGYAEAVEDVVPGHVVRDEPEERSQCTRFAAGARPRQLSDRLGLAA